MPTDRREIVSFNAIRGIAALAVCASHLRAFLLVRFPEVQTASHVDRIFYFVTGLGHQAVVIFFVMSGWLVGGSVWQQQLSGRFSWRDYATARLTRLWIVLVPALLWTIGSDTIGTWLSGGVGYDGSQRDVLSSGPGGDAPISLTTTTLIGNIFFLQTILVPVMGTNGPLWSLANEFWYYLMFPLLAFAWHRRSSYRAFGLGMFGLVILLVLPTAIRDAFAIWLLGWFGSIVYPNVRAVVAKPLALVSLILLAAALAASKQGFAIGSDLVLGITATGLLVGLRAVPNTRVLFPWVRSAASHLARISYTLYLFHFPLLALFFFSLHLQQQQPTGLAYVEFVGLLAAVLVIATALWYLFERRTDSVRRILSRTFVAPSAAMPRNP
jgi:peptidoglycan/LPS O-acetylase OafA/YrhL